MTSGRPATLPGAESMIGLLINTVPAVVRIDEARPVADWLHDVQCEQSEAREFEFFPLSRAQALASGGRGTPLFDILFVFENYGANNDVREMTSALRVERVQSVETPHYPITFTVTPAATLRFDIVHDLDAVDAESARHLLLQTLRVLESMARDGDARVGDLALVSGQERALLLAQGRGTETAPRSLSVAHGDGLAIAGDGVTITYAALHERAGAIAAALHARVARAEERVAVVASRPEDVIVAALGVLQTGCAYLPVDPATPPERLRWMLENARVRIAVVDDAGARLVPEIEQIALAGLPPAPFTPPYIDPLQLAYVVYTSGSTGRPKGVMVSRAALANLAYAAAERFALAPGDRVLQFASPAFDTFGEEVFPTLLRGATIVVGARVQAFEEWTELLRRQRVTVLDLPTGYLREWARWLEESGTPMPEALRLLVLGGEAVDSDILARWRRIAPHIPWMNSYGPTEATITATFNAPSDMSVAIGTAIENACAYVLDERMQPAGTGVVGEIFLGGLPLARGYEARPDLTAERFVPSPFGAGQRLYRTGDLGRVRPGGAIEFCGRIDHQIKLRGFRIELGEIEAVLREHPAVREAAVVVADGKLIAYVIGTADADALRAHARARLPEYSLPAAFVALEAMPRTTGNKVDRKRLPAWNAASAATEEYAAPEGEIERQLAEIWQRTLRVERVGRHDNFFALGGDSIVSMQIIAGARQAGLRIQPRDVFLRQSIAELAAVAGKAQPAPRPRARAHGVVILTPVQRWFFEQEYERPQRAAQAFLFTLAPDIDRGRLQSALDAVVARHDALRFRFRNGEQFLGDDTPRIALRETDGHPERAADALAGELDLANGPLAAGAFAGDALLLVAHHLVVDAHSWRVLLDELCAAYEGRELPPPGESFQRWGECLQRFIPAAMEEAPYWLEYAGEPFDRLKPDSDAENALRDLRTLRL
ncbi:MAG TPA: amino acid adenylation domain-containing protein, partial [Thermoanaerobaculia bacterium]|nr:amino acid adenylation domain-containing protein [Thermoanaerobaculia bacterium]